MPLHDSKFKERRRQQRVRFKAPASVTAGHHSIAASTKDVSDRGLFFLTDARFELGSEIDILVELPEEVELLLSGMVCCHGRVVRSDCSGGQCGMGVQIDRLAPVPQV
jgi:Tfp pilus assembly protein PilZ